MNIEVAVPSQWAAWQALTVWPVPRQALGNGAGRAKRNRTLRPGRDGSWR